VYDEHVSTFTIEQADSHSI